MACTPASNPVALTVSQNHTIYLSCLAHAAYQQKVIASFNGDLSNPVAVFTGSGENVLMTTSNGQTVATVPTGANQRLYVLFQFSPGGGFQNAVRVCQPQTAGVVTQVSSEDSIDNDDNDSYFFLVNTKR